MNNSNLLKLLNDLKIVICIPVGRAGSYFFQSLMDNNDQIISFPDRFDFKSFDLELFVNNNKKYFNSKYNNYNSGNKFLSHDEKVKFKLCEKTFINNYNELANIKSSISNRERFILYHLAFANLINKDLRKIRYIFCHIHNLNGEELKILKNLVIDFKKPKIIVMTRDIRETISSYLDFSHKKNSIRGIELIKGLHLYLTSTYIPFFKFYNELKKPDIKIIDLNLFHLKGENNIKKIVKWLEIEFENNMTKSTVLGEPWFGNSSSKNKINGFNKSRGKLNYSKKLSVEEIMIIERLFHQIILKFGYNLDYTMNESKHLMKVNLLNYNFLKPFSLVEILILSKSINNKVFKSFPGFFKNIIIFFIYGCFPNIRSYFKFKKLIKESFFEKSISDLEKIRFDKNIFLCQN